MAERIGPFTLQGYDAFEEEHYDIHPVSEHMYDTFDEALEGAKRSGKKFKKTNQKKQPQIYRTCCSS